MKIKLWATHGGNNEPPPGYDNQKIFYTRVDWNLLPRSTIFIGDSTIQGLAVSSITERAVNFGIGGDTTEGVLDRLSKYNSLTPQTTVLVKVGLNDLKIRSDDEIIVNFKEIINKLSHVEKFIICSIQAIDEENQPEMSGFNRRIQHLNEEIKTMVFDINNAVFLEVNLELTNSDGNLRNDLHIGDGVHLNQIGSQILIDKIQLSLSKSD